MPCPVSHAYIEMLGYHMLEQQLGRQFEALTLSKLANMIMKSIYNGPPP